MKSIVEFPLFLRHFIHRGRKKCHRLFLLKSITQRKLQQYHYVLENKFHPTTETGLISKNDKIWQR